MTFVQAPTSLIEVALDGTPHSILTVVGFVQVFNHVKFMTLSTRATGTLHSATNKFSACFDRLTKLVIMLDHCDFVWVMDLVHCCPQLKVLSIQRCLYSSYTFTWSKPISVPKCFLSSFTQVSYRGFEGLENEMSLLQFILNHALVMEIVDIRCVPWVKDRMKENFHLLDRMSTFSKGSPTCKISSALLRC
ncbi:OLC1v1025638C1 [Oldenlandia corymbosa var. corymbosa]|uniref:OLC1v1025638C1 n=1 Tax=Oldenlandia corymbosa var. corymbosa TaxID=529605 RepID=A0AAV1C5D8_OLDCO|nr:OLC1v1025638C1 [Oldenlandia corymbosa var. corymbosa]